ncbi:hypothetical protein BTO20_11525 [Mycobacterium dioxanotrophicus]|uniref:Minor tail protein n=1 Tax=Mycobacterium dioxanotrophicus TaxID=482462 RepID=A0A1Y0C1Y5_9MYCO|nr:hypothetical protein [Mycobacterium dioxanotrophicus]ART69127.1 hypothetical protein BTO20_11525 [Mycobacterium dioxanotrophicus]
MTDPLPDWMRQTPNLESLHNLPDVPWGGYSKQGVPLPSLPDLTRLVLQLLEKFLGDVVLALVGVLVPGSPAFDQLKDFAESIPVIGDIIQIVETVLKTAPIAAVNIVGSIIHLLTRVPAGAITNETPNLQAAPWASFAEGSIADNPDWTVDLAKSRTADGTGAARVVADGRTKVLRSGEPRGDVSAQDDYIAVGAGQSITESVFVAHEGYSGTGAAILLQVVPFTAAGAGTPVQLDAYTPAAADLAWPGRMLSGVWAVPDGVIGYQKRYVLTSDATAGTFFLDDASGRQTGKIPQSAVDNLPEALQDMLGRWQLLIGVIVGAFGGVGDTLEDLAETLVNIPAHVIKGVLGAAGLDDDLQAVVNILAKALGHKGSGNASLGELLNLAGMVKNAASMGQDALGILGVRNAEPVSSGMMATGDSNYPWANANTWVPVAPGVAKGVTHRIGKDRPMGVVSWYGYGNVGITGAYVIALGIDATTGLRTVKHVSPNIAGLLPPGSTVADRGWVFYEIETADAVTQKRGEDWEYSVMFVGGTHHIWGLSYADAIVDHPYAQVKSFGFEHSWSSPPALGSTVTKAAATSSPDVLWIETAIETGNTASQHEPMWLYLGTEPTEIAVPNWCARVIAVARGDGGGGHLGGSVGFAGQGGEPGLAAVAVWDRGVDFPGEGTTLIALNPGPGGAAGASPLAQNGGDGVGTTMSIPGRSVTAEGGKGGKGVRFVLTSGKPVGRGTGSEPFAYEGYEFPGGGDQNAYSGDGIAPGGGANGGNWSTVTAGGRGAKGGGWVVFLPGDPVGGSTPPPVTNVPPPPPIISLAEATFSSITINLAQGSTLAGVPRVRSVGSPKRTQILTATGVPRTRSVGVPSIGAPPPMPTYVDKGVGGTGTGVPSAFNFTAPAGADLFIVVSTDRTSNINGAKLDGVTNSAPVAGSAHNNVTTYGSTKVYRFAGAGTGTGSPQSVQAVGSGIAWWVVQVVAVSGVSSVGEPTIAFGNGDTVTQELPAGFGLQIIGSGGGGSGGGTLSAITGVTNRSLLSTSGTSQAISTKTTAATMTAALSTPTAWAAIHIPLSS